VAITAGNIYVASYLAPAGHYADDQNYFASSGVTNGPLTALSNSAAGGNGVYLYGLSGGFPTNTYQSSNYYVDVVFSSAITGATIFGNTTPTIPSQADPRSVELGVKFESSVAGTITGIRFYKGSGNTGTHVGYLWTDTGTLLDSATFTGETASGWQQVNFTTPVAITAGTIYVASYLAPAGHYADDQSYFASSGVTNGPLTALSNSAAGGNGVYLYGLSGGFPTNTYQSSNYYVDVVFSSTLAQVVTKTAAASDAIAGNDRVAGGTTNEGGNTAALDAILAGWTSSDSSTSRISKIMNRVAEGTNANTLSNGGSQTQNNNVFLTLTSLPADKLHKKPGETDTNL